MNNNFETVIGLEVHAELNTKTKIFCSCENRFGAEVNTLCCPICMGQMCIRDRPAPIRGHFGIGASL